MQAIVTGTASLHSFTTFKNRHTGEIDGFEYDADFVAADFGVVSGGNGAVREGKPHGVVEGRDGSVHKQLGLRWKRLGES